MSDYSNAHDITRLTGSPPSFVGHDSTVDLFERVRKNPNLVICVDEVDRAHPKVIEFFIKLREQGIHKDHQGRTVDFRNVTFVYTSNVTEHVDMNAFRGFTNDKKLRRLIEILIRREKPEHFPPAFLNGMTDIVRFNEFSEKGKILIVEKIWNKWRKIFNNGDAKIDVKLSPEVIEWLAQNSEGGSAAKIMQIIRSEVLRYVKDMNYKKGDLIDVELNPAAGMDEPPFTILVRDDLRDLNLSDLEVALREREQLEDISTVLRRASDDVEVRRLTNDEMDEIIQNEDSLPNMDLNNLKPEEASETTIDTTSKLNSVLKDRNQPPVETTPVRQSE
jgi:hypothetical protein